KVIELKTSLHRLRVSNERRRAKLEDRWASKAAAATRGREEAIERQRGYARQLENDIEAMAKTLVRLERQVCNREGKDLPKDLAWGECARQLKKAREAWMAAEKA
ncbi:unnamed protein product, partial [Discosporangium mesarthrocarpum]